MNGLPRLRRVVIVLVEEQLTPRERMRHALETLGATVLTSDSSVEALRIMHEIIPSAIMADLSSADGAGHALVAGLRMLPSARSVPVISFDRASLPVDPARLFTMISQALPRPQVSPAPPAARPARGRRLNG